MGGELGSTERELLRAIMVANGDEAKSAMITEGGWNDHPRWTRAVRPGQRIDYTIRAGRIYSIIGPNGAGKTTTLNALLGLIDCDGQIEVR